MSKATPLKIELVNDPQQLWFSGKNAPPITLTFVNNDTRHNEMTLINIVRADLLLKNDLTLTPGELQGGGYKPIDEGWFEVRYEAPLPWQPIDDWDNPFELGSISANGGIRSCEIRLNVPDDNVDYGRICFAIMISAKMVDDPVVYSCTIDQEYFYISSGKTKQATATVVADDEVDTSVYWTIDKPEIATVDANGLITGVGEGRAIITAASAVNQFYNSSRFIRGTLVPPVVYSCNIDQASFSLGIGAISQATATVVADTYADLSVTWSIADTDIATVDANGLITGVAAGTTTITATSNADPDFSDTVSLETTYVLYEDDYESYAIDTLPSNLTYYNGYGAAPIPKVEDVTFLGTTTKALVMNGTPTGTSEQFLLWTSPVLFTQNSLVFDGWITPTGIQKIVLANVVDGRIYRTIIGVDFQKKVDSTYVAYFSTPKTRPAADWVRVTIHLNMKAGPTLLAANVYLDKVLVWQNIGKTKLPLPNAIGFYNFSSVPPFEGTDPKFCIENVKLYTGTTAAEIWALDEPPASTFIFDIPTQAITGYISNGETTVTIPATIDGVTVLRLKAGAFGDYGITTVIIPDTVTTLEDGCFHNNNAIINAQLGLNVTIGYDSMGAYSVEFSYSYTVLYSSAKGTYIFNGQDFIKQ